MRIDALIVAAGQGLRARSAGRGDSEIPKQYRPVGGVPILARSAAAFRDHPAIRRVAVAIADGHQDLYRQATASLPGLEPPVLGGATRQDSVRNGLEALAARDPPDAVLIHDAARPFVSAAVIDGALAALAQADGAIPALPVADTLKAVGTDGKVNATVPRGGLFAAQTPQAFRLGAILSAHRAAAVEGRTDFTDDAAVGEWAGLSVAVAPGDVENVKLTSAEDIAAADRRLKLDVALALADVRTGIGYDVHALGEGAAVTLGGVAIPHHRALVGHSDADVVLHALTDAVLGALGEGDIGQHFPPSDPRWRGAASAVFLADAVGRVRARGGVVAHLDATILAEAPRIGPHRDEMRERIAAIAGIALDRVGLKATTNERLGAIGRGEGIAAMAAATIRLPLKDAWS